MSLAYLIDESPSLTGYVGSQPRQGKENFVTFRRVAHAYANRSNVIDVYVGHLRDKVDRPFGTSSIETVRGVGYRLRVPEAS